MGSRRMAIVLRLPCGAEWVQAVSPKATSSHNDACTKEGACMLYYALVFLIVAIIAGLLGFGAISFAAAGVAKILFFIFLILFLISLVRHVSTRA